MHNMAEAASVPEDVAHDDLCPVSQDHQSDNRAFSGSHLMSRRYANSSSLRPSERSATTCYVPRVWHSGLTRPLQTTSSTQAWT